MKKHFLTVTLVFFILSKSYASDYYVSPGATGSGNGSLANGIYWLNIQGQELEFHEKFVVFKN